MHHADDALAGGEGHLAAFPIGAGNGGATWERHAEHFGQRVHGQRRAHGVAMADGGGGGGHHLHEFLVLDFAFGQQFAAFPDDGAGAGEAALPPAIQHRAAGEHDGGDVDGGSTHQAGRGGFVAAGGEHDAIERVAVQHFDQREIGEVTVERRGGALAGFLNGVDGEFQRDAAGVANAFLHPHREVHVVAVAGGDVAAGLGDADDRLAALQFFAGEAEIEVALYIERGHGRVGGIVEPAAAAQAAVHVVIVVRHRVSPKARAGAKWAGGGYGVNRSRWRSSEVVMAGFADKYRCTGDRLGDRMPFMSSAILTDTLKRAATWPPEAQAELAAYAAEIQAGLSDLPYVPSAAEYAGIDRGLADAAAGRFAAPDAVEQVFARYRRG